MTTQIESLKLALDEIKRVKEICLREVGIGLCNEIVIAKLEEALEQEKALQALHDENERLGLYKDAYAQPEQELDYRAIGKQAYESGYSTGYMDCAVKMKAQPEQKYRRGNRLICLETEEYCVIHISGTDRQWVKFPDSHIGVYTNEQVAELFELLPKELEQPEQEPTNDWSEWRGMVVQNLMRHGIDKDFARRLAHFYQDKAPQPKEPEQRSVSEHLEPVAWLQIGVGPLHEGHVIARTTKPKEWNPEWWKFEPLYTTPQRKPLTPEQIAELDCLDHFKFARAIEAAYGIKE